ncbi:TerB N-terminal domain-containing protein [bacterium]|nr:TerB N-terminal domain-containing protein [bacterium]
MGFLFFVILIIIIVNVANSSKNNQSNISYQENSYSTPTYSSYNSYYRSSTPKLKFHSKTDTVNLFGYSITNSLFYTCDSKSDMPFAINTKSTPSFGITPSEGLNYWPNYNQISKTQQGYFIKWLADGKPFVEELGYAYIYYYGLEYRALVEKQDQKKVLFEIIDLVNKFKRLRYGYDLIAYLVLSIKNFSFDEIDKILEFFKNNEQEYMYNPAYNSIIKNLTPNGQYQVKFSPYQFLNNNEYNNLSDRKNELLSYYFSKIIEELDENEIYTTKLQNYSYYMAMGYYRTTNSVAYNAIIPATKLKRSWNQARKIIKDEIKQTVKKFDSSAEPLTEIEKLAYLPSKLRSNINYSFNIFDFEEKAISDVGTIAEKLGFKIQDKATLRQSTLIADACEALGYEIEPNVNIDKKPYKKDILVSIYKSQYPKKLSPIDYQIASLFTDIGYQIALEDNELLQVEIAYIENYIKKEFNLSPSERYRLQMRGELLVHTKEINTSETIKKLIKMLDDSGKETIAKYIISVAMADGVVKDSELRILQKIFKQLDFSEDYLNLTLNELINNADDVVVVEKGTTTKKKGSKIPTNIETEEKIELKLDTEKLEKIKINTSEIQNVLQEIFADEQAEVLKSEPPETVSAENEDKVEIENGLQGIINIIIEKENWTRNELLNIIQNKGVMLSSAIDEINEWSEEEYGDFLVEEDDDVYIVNEEVVNLIKK